MKITQTILTSICFTLIMSSTSYAKKGNDKNKDRENRKAKKQKMLDRFDADKDGKLSSSERKTAKETIKTESAEIEDAMLKKFDSDGNGRVDKEENVGVEKWFKKTYPQAIETPRDVEKKIEEQKKRDEKEKGENKK